MVKYYCLLRLHILFNAFVYQKYTNIIHNVMKCKICHYNVMQENDNFT